jgi:signal transduction histidine kinase
VLYAIVCVHLRRVSLLTYPGKMTEVEAKGRLLAAILDQIPHPCVAVHQDGEILLANNAWIRMGWGESDALVILSSLAPGAVEGGPLELFSPAGKGAFSVRRLEAPEQKIDFLLLQEAEAPGEARSSADIAQFVSRAKDNSLRDTFGGVAHELNNPLAVIMGKSAGIVRVLQSSPPDLDKARNDLGRIEANAKRMSKTIQAARSVFGGDEDEIQRTFRWKEMLEDVLEICGARIRQHGIELKVDAEADFEIKGQPSQLKKAFAGLLQNAHDAVNGTESPWIELRMECKNGRLFVRILDSGKIGDRALIAKIGTPLFTTRENSAGIGVFMAKKIIEKHGGKLVLEQGEPNTCFLFDLPCGDGGKQKE